MYHFLQIYVTKFVMVVEMEYVVNKTFLSLSYLFFFLFISP